jgi:phosphatidylglycerol:prolipoprotein diacylglycerol transferase
MLLGLAIGRIGCLMNGCCYGGECPPEYPLGVRFPVEAPAYYDQLCQGRLLGLRGEWDSEADYPLRVTAIDPEGYVARNQLPIEVGERLKIVAPGSDFLVAIKSGELDLPMMVLIQLEGSEEPLRVPVVDLPNRSLYVHPAQIYASISAALVCLVLWFAFPLRKFDGQLFAGLLLLYPVSRLLEEVIRSDENGVFGTPLTISQWVSVLLIFLGVGMWWWLSRRPILTWRVPAG